MVLLMIHLVLILIFLAGAARFVSQGLHSYRSGRAGVSLFLDQSIEHRTQPALYWTAMAVHALLVTMFLGIAAFMVVKLL